MTYQTTDLLDDDLTDIFGSDLAMDAAAIAAGVELAANVQVRMHEQTCTKCRGSGRFIGYTGRDFGQCFACKGKGKMFFRQSLAERQKKAEQAAARKERSAAASTEAFAEANPAEWAWMTSRAPRFNFAAEMVATVRKFGRLTEKQLAATTRYAQQDAARDAERASVVAAPAAVQTVSIAAIRECLTAAKRSKAKLHFADFCYSMASASSANVGCVYVTTPGDEYLGKVTIGGQFQTVRACSAELKAAVLAHIATMTTAEEVRAAAILSGRETGTCCCCGRELTDPESVEAGIGPICASKWSF